MVLAFLLAVLCSVHELITSYIYRYLENSKKLADLWILPSAHAVTALNQTSLTRKRASTTHNMQSSLSKSQSGWGFSSFSRRIHLQTELTLFSDLSDTDPVGQSSLKVKPAKLPRAVLTTSVHKNASYFYSYTNNDSTYPSSPPLANRIHRQRAYTQRTFMPNTPIKLEEYTCKNINYIAQKNLATGGLNANGKKLFVTPLPRVHNAFNPKPPRSFKTRAAQQKKHPFQPTQLSVIFENLAY